MSMEELKACPFCGGDNIVVKPEDSFYYVESEFPFAKCLDCGVMIKAEKYYNTGRKGFDVTWNTRSYESDIESLQAENAKLRDELFQSEGGRIRQRSEIAKLKAKLEVAEKVLEWFENPDHAIGSNAEKIWKFHKIAQEALSTLREKEVE